MAPTPWQLPASGGTISSTSANFHNIYHAGDYWFSVSRVLSTGLTLRYASDPTGAWGTATLPAFPPGVTSVTPVDSGGVQYDGTHYAFALAMGTASRLYYASDPGGTWTDFQFDSTGYYLPRAILHDGSRWIMAGRYDAPATNPEPAWIGYTGAGSAVNSTWTFGTAAADTGYDVADLGASGTRVWNISALDFDGTHYVAAATRLPTSGIDGHLRYCTDITAASWGTPTTTQIEQVNELRYYPDAGYWISFGPNPRPWYASDPTGTWTEIGTATTLLVNEVLGMAYGDGYWVAAGALEDPFVYPRLTYLQEQSPAAATYTAIGSADTQFTQDTVSYVYSVEYHGGYWVAGAEYDCELNWCFTGQPTGPFLLRQRQSPRRSPSRVGWY